MLATSAGGTAVKTEAGGRLEVWGWFGPEAEGRGWRGCVDHWAAGGRGKPGTVAGTGAEEVEAAGGGSWLEAGFEATVGAASAVVVEAGVDLAGVVVMVVGSGAGEWGGAVAVEKPLRFC